MFRINLSIGSKMTLSTCIFIGIIVGLALISTVRLVSIDQKTEQLDSTWLAATQVLGELSDRVSEFRLAETYRALDANPKTLTDDEALANVHRQAVADLESEYGRLGKGSSVADLSAFRAAWGTYLAAHDAWVAGDAAGLQDDPAQRTSALHLLYRSADNSIDDLIASNAGAAGAEHEAVDRLVNQTIIIMLAASALAVLLGAFVLNRVWANVVRPLGAITAALSRLAAGSHDVTVPELNRKDEIGALAKAFDVFRRNAVALELAHTETQQAQAQAQALARHDALTGLPNRRVFAAELETALDRANSGTSVATVLSIDLDRFKPVNDLYGHAVGDIVLCEIAARLKRALRHGDTVARLGGDEFAIVGNSLSESYPEGVIRLANRVLSVIREPITIGEMQVEIGGSIGIASAPGDGVDADALMRAADIAMYRAKQSGRGKFHFFEPSMDEELRAQAALEVDLRKAIANGDIKPFYQPLIDMHDNHVYGFEVLARWKHPTRGWVGPDVFIPLAEQLGLISDLTAVILRQACRDARYWDKGILLSVNVSPLQLKDVSLPTQILSILSQEDFPPSRLEIEITETALVSDLEIAKQILTALQIVGIKISLDDFGTGYSSLYHLRQLKFDKLKIDRSFVQSMGDNAESEKIVDAILGLAKSIGLPTVAEGIENVAVLQRLAGKGCEFGQGYYFGKAMDAASAEELMASNAALKKVG